MIAYQTIFYTIGVFILYISGAMVAPCLVDYWHQNSNWIAFFQAIVISLFTGLVLIAANRSDKPTLLTIRDTYILTTFCWISISICAALPFIFAAESLSLIDCLFEAVSGLTTTGASVMPDIDHAPAGIKLWRSILQWLGGIGIIVMGLTVMPNLKVGGLQLFRNEFSDQSEKIHPKLARVAQDIFYVYVLFTVLCALCLAWAGMSTFEAICHAMTTLSTGGFSTTQNSIGFYNSQLIEFIITIFMIIGATTLLLLARIFQGDIKSLITDPQVCLFYKLILIMTAILTFYKYQQGLNLTQALFQSSFAVTSIITTSGFNSGDYNTWGHFPMLLLILLMQIGGCTGSTASSFKIYRLQILLASLRTYIAQMQQPSGIFIARYNGKQISNSAFHAVFTFMCLYVISFFAISVCLSLCDMDVTTCIIAATSMLNNVGSMIGADNNIISFNDSAKIILILAMLLGRLEYIAIVILFNYKFWRD